MTHAPLAGSARWTGTDSGLLRVGLHLLLAALPLLAISAHVFGLVRMQVSAAILVVPLATALIALTVFAPHAGDRVLAHGMFWGIVGCAIYDIFRLDTVYMLHWWADFIPTMGTWITGDDNNLVSGAVVGYLWRYIGDGGGIGITFFALASAVGLHQRSRAVVVGASVAFSVFPVWAGLIGTVALASRGQTLMFPLTPTTITLSLIGHLIFGLIMGLGFWRSRSVQQHWPWEPLSTSSPRAAAVPSPRSGSFVAPPSGPVATDRKVRREHAPTYSGPLPSVPAAATGAPSVARPANHPVPPTPGSTVPPPPSRPERSMPSMPVPAVAFAPESSTRTASELAGETGIEEPALPRPRDRGTPPRGVARAGDDAAAGSTLDPHTWELWQRQMDTTVRGRRTHRARR